MMASWWLQVAPWIQGLFGGAAALLLWETLLKPMRERRSLSEVLAADLSQHLQAAAAGHIQRRAHPKTVPGENPFPLGIFDAVTARVGELPSALVGDVVMIYRILRRLNECAARAARLCEQMQHTDHPERAGLFEELLVEHLADYERLLENFGERFATTQPRLIDCARPWWSPRTWRSRSPETLDARKLETAMLQLSAARDDRARSIKDS
ncbi:MAG: hypothetical protein ACYC3F_05280 [Gemmatimonadaceae bacterium]